MWYAAIRSRPAKDAATREQILVALENRLRSGGAKGMVANRGYKRYLKAGNGAVDVVLRYKQLWMVEQIFRTARSLLDTRPIFHKTDAAICGHVFCSFLALVLRDALFRRIDAAGVSASGMTFCAT